MTDVTTTPIHALRSNKKHKSAPFLPMSRIEMKQLGWNACDIILVTGDAYIDHPSFGMALIGRLLEDQGFKVGIISQPDWHSAEDFKALGKPRLFFGVSAGNMDSMVNHYTADRKPRSDDAYTAAGVAGKRPDRAVAVYAQRCREAYPGTDIMVGGIEASLRRIAQYDYWSEKVRQSALVYSKADMLLFGNAERALVEVAHRAAAGERLADIRDVRGTSFMVPYGWRPEGWTEMDSSTVDVPGRIDSHINPYIDTTQATEAACDSAAAPDAPKTIRIVSREERLAARRAERAKTVIRIPAFEAVAYDPVLYAHASRTLHLESNPGNARALVQTHGERDVWMNPPPIPLTTPEMDYVYGLDYARNPHPVYEGANIPAWEMIRFSVNIMRGCFGGCTFCSITEHEGRIIQSRSEASILGEIEEIRDKTEGFTGHISDLGGPTANMYRLTCKDEKIEASCRRLSCVYPDICENMNTDHGPLIQLYRKARTLPGVKRLTIGSGVRYDLAVRSPEYVKELVTHHVSGYLKIAPEHTEEGTLSKMMKPGIGSYYRFKELFERYSKQAGKKQYLIPYFIAAHPGTSDEDMLNLALWIKDNGFRPDQVQTFTPTPMALATTMWHTGRNPLKKLARSSEKVDAVRDPARRRLHKAFLRFHDPKNWPTIRNALEDMGRADLIGNGPQHLVPPWGVEDKPGFGKQGSPRQSPAGNPRRATGSVRSNGQTQDRKLPTARNTSKPAGRPPKSGKR
ncbi:YgiQ family radical SAM protein [Craterilacuibacter sinensis]|uniref:YgiQ family radical SAM protein n=1 Tax=Craterilacuibacter sinensis TaxID=2686017 RepID=A0A845BUK0_9NEIS|nr:YgiQ family radical SAM protein [Craterilacuibacter sinensis]MXR36203.1 YgiQ family radical SAM protein [Craterilacuibacter sinensis]